jgi:hypothetical protein
VVDTRNADDAGGHDGRSLVYHTGNHWMTEYLGVVLTLSLR